MRVRETPGLGPSLHFSRCTTFSDPNSRHARSFQESDEDMKIGLAVEARGLGRQDSGEERVRVVRVAA